MTRTRSTSPSAPPSCSATRRPTWMKWPGSSRKCGGACETSYEDFIQTSAPRHHAGCREFIQKVYDNGAIYKGNYEGLYCEGCEAFKTERDLDEQGRCPNHLTVPVRRSEPCYFFALSKFQ